MQRQPDISVGILSAAEINITLLTDYHAAGDSLPQRGSQSFELAPGGRVAWQGKVYDSVELIPADSETGAFEIADVVIGVNFHWERRENQRFSGSCRVIAEGDKLTIINVLPVEDYLLSVISSEMSAHASLELLKAHAVISRSWLLAQIDKTRRIKDSGEAYSAMTLTDDELIKWYDREDHVNFDVCADDHCQRYQGITRQSTAKVAEAIAATHGQVLTDPTADGALCDARFSKCCGGVFEEFEYCWEPLKPSYLVARRDSTNPADYPDLRIEAEADRWINSRPEAFCNTSDTSILQQVLNNYDQETTDFYRWRVEYSRQQLAGLVKQRSGIDFGDIIDLQPLDRGSSGRIWRLRIVGTRRTMIIGKELEIRRTLSPSHLYSSAFTVERHDIDPATGVPGRIVLNGGGWGHGVGLCQIGAAVMGAKGYPYRDILAHYFPGASLETLY